MDIQVIHDYSNADMPGHHHFKKGLIAASPTPFCCRNLLTCSTVAPGVYQQTFSTIAGQTYETKNYSA